MSDDETPLSIGERQRLRLLMQKYESAQDQLKEHQSSLEEKEAELTKLRKEAAKVPSLESELERVQNVLAAERESHTKAVAALEAEVAKLKKQTTSNLPMELATGKNDSYVSLPMSVVLVDAIRTGWLLKMGNKRDNWKKRFCVLKDNYLFYYKTDKKDTETKAKFVRLNGGKVSRGSTADFKRENVIVVQANIYLGKSRTYCFQSNFDADANDWLSLLAKVIDELPRDAKYEDASDAADAGVAAAAAGGSHLGSASDTPKPRPSSRNRTSTINRIMGSRPSSSSSPSSSPLKKQPAKEFHDETFKKHWIVKEYDAAKTEAEWRVVALAVSVDDTRLYDAVTGEELRMWSPRWIRVVKFTTQWVAFIGRDSDSAMNEQEWRFMTDLGKQVHDVYFEFVNVFLKKQRGEPVEGEAGPVSASMKNTPKKVGSKKNAQLQKVAASD